MRKKIVKLLRVFELAIAIGLIIVFMMLFYTALHNIDLSFNIALISNDLNANYDGNFNFRNWEDSYQIGKSMSYENIYILSMGYLIYSFFGILIAGILLADSLNHFCNKK